MHHFITDLTLQSKPYHLDPTEAHHALAVLRIAQGDLVSLTDGAGMRWEAQLSETDKLDVVNEMWIAPPRSPVTVVLSLIDFGRVEWAIEKCVELGIAHLVLTHTDRSQQTLSHAEKKLGRWRQIVRAAVKQSGRCFIPDITLRPWGEVMIHMADYDQRYIAHLDLHAMSPDTATPGSRLVLVGPEGGFTEREIDEATSQGYIPLRLSDATLRAETAAMTAVALLHQA